MIGLSWATPCWPSMTSRQFRIGRFLHTARSAAGHHTISMCMYSYLYGRLFNFFNINPLIHSILSCNLPEDQLDQIAHQDALTSCLNTKSQLLLNYMWCIFKSQHAIIDWILPGILQNIISNSFSNKRLSSAVSDTLGYHSADSLSWNFQVLSFLCWST